MLENLLNSKLKRRLLNIFFSFPHRSFSTYELRLITRASVPVLNQALREYLRAEVVSAAAKGSRRYYGINPHFRFYAELKDLVSEDDFRMDDEVVALLKKIPNVKQIVLSGIFTLQPKQPVDILVVGERINSLRLQRTVAEIEKLVGEEVNYASLVPQDYHHRRMMSDRLIRDIFDYPHFIVLNQFK